MLSPHTALSTMIVISFVQSMHSIVHSPLTPGCAAPTPSLLVPSHADESEGEAEETGGCQRVVARVRVLWVVARARGLWVVVAVPVLSHYRHVIRSGGVH